MNILLVGNGFDLAHGLPTSYVDFLKFCKSANDVTKYSQCISELEIYKEYVLNKWDINDSIKNKLYKILVKKNSDDYLNKETRIYYENLQAFYEITNDNFWIKYFFENDMHGAENWIDFESEISNVIKSITDKMYNSETELSLYDKISEWPKEWPECYLKDCFNNHNIGMTYKELRDRLLLDLNKLIRAFEIYLADYVEKININKISPDIKEIKELGVDCILSFNYTHVFFKEYIESENNEEEQKVLFDYIHGEANINNSIGSNNMVLGIDEYLGKKKRNKQTEFIAFKKYFQRIHKGTGCKCKEWLGIINKDRREMKNQLGVEFPKHITFEEYENKGKGHYLYIFGHSLDVTDKDILREFILNNNMHTTIFYRNLDQKGQQIANLVKVIGQDELIKRTGGGNARTIEFKLQQPMAEKPAENSCPDNQVSETSN